MQKKITLEFSIDPGKQGEYLFLPFTMPSEVESLALRYSYPRFAGENKLIGKAAFTARREINIIDLGLIAPDGSQVGASGSDKREFIISETQATPGYTPCPLVPGEWRILVGAYKVAPAGVKVTYELTFTFKSLRLLKGDLHTHTLASDGVMTAAELADRSLRHGLDFLAITDHNQPVSKASLPQLPGVTLIPGMEWTHYQGHANFLGVDHPYDESFAANTLEEVSSRFESARSRGALIVLNHPCDENCPFVLDQEKLPFDCLEVWNGPMRISNLQAVGLWQSMLVSGRKVPICGGSDYHRDTPFLFLGGPTTCVYALSTGPSDILAALRQGHAYVTFAPNGPSVELAAGSAIIGDSVPWVESRELRIQAAGLGEGDLLRVVTASGAEDLLVAPSAGQAEVVFPLPGPGFARVEIWRTFIPGVPQLPALLSNPIYFDG